MRKVKQLLPSFGLSLNKGYIAPWQTSCYQYHYAFPGMFNLSLCLGSLAFLTGDQNAKFFRHLNAGESILLLAFKPIQSRESEAEARRRSYFIPVFLHLENLAFFNLFKNSSACSAIHGTGFYMQAFTC